MHRNYALFYGIRGIAVIVLSLLLIVACSNKNVVNDDPGNLDLEAINSVELAKTVYLDNPGLAKSDLAVYSISKVEYGFEITSRASSTSFYIDNQLIKIDVPANAFDQSKWGARLYIYIRAEKWSTSYGNVYYYECTPEGVQFEHPLVFHQPYQNRNGGNEYLYWYNPNYKFWVVEDSDKLNSGSATFEINHFSKYAIAD